MILSEFIITELFHVDMLHTTYGNGITTANSKDPHAYRTVTLLLGFYLKIRTDFVL